MEVTIDYLLSGNCHRPLTKLLKSMRSDLLDKKICRTCKTVCMANVKKCVSCSGTLCAISEDLVFENFVSDASNLGHDVDVRFYPGTGFNATNNPEQNVRLIPGDPDSLPPTTRENIAVLMNKAGNR